MHKNENIWYNKRQKQRFFVSVKLENYKFITIAMTRLSRKKAWPDVRKIYALLVGFIFSLFLLRVDIPWFLRFFERDVRCNFKAHSLYIVVLKWCKQEQRVVHLCWSSAFPSPLLCPERKVKGSKKLQNLYSHRVYKRQWKQSPVGFWRACKRF